MSELNNNEDLNDVVEEVIDDAEVVTVPIDDTLTISGEAADAKATGDALALKADKSEIQTQVTVNGQAADANANITLLASDIPMTNENEAATVSEMISQLTESIGENADDIDELDAAAVKVTEQALTSAQKMQARANLELIENVTSYFSPICESGTISSFYAYRVGNIVIGNMYLSPTSNKAAGSDLDISLGLSSSHPELLCFQRSSMVNFDNAKAAEIIIESSELMIFMTMASAVQANDELNGSFIYICKGDSE